MKRNSVVFLQIVLIIIALGTIALLLWEPHLEGRNASATTFEIYFKDPFLAYVYIASIPFFAALYQAFKLLHLIGANKVFSRPAVQKLRNIKYCGIAIIAFLAGAEAYLVTMQRSTGEDIAGGVMIGLAMMFISVVTTTAAALFEKMLQSAVDIKSENDLTV